MLHAPAALQDPIRFLARWHKRQPKLNHALVSLGLALFMSVVFTDCCSDFFVVG